MTTATTTERKPSTRARRLWRRLVQTYGTKMAEQYGPNPSPDWCAVIDRTDDERLEAALVQVRHTYVDWPPTLPQFEAAIPGRQVERGDSMFDRLAVGAVKRFTSMCGHQSSKPWNYYGPCREEWNENWKQMWRIPEPKGVVIPPCDTEGCPRFGKPGFRFTVADL